jgi:hypothetical protein
MAFYGPYVHISACKNLEPNETPGTRMQPFKSVISVATFVVKVSGNYNAVFNYFPLTLARAWDQGYCML